jgi:hypothetical protein
MSIKIFKEEFIYNLGKSKEGERIYMSGSEIVERYNGSKKIGLNSQQTAKLRKIARQILFKS